MARYLITGGAGFIGCNLVRYVLSKGHRVVVLDDFSTGKRENLRGLEGRIELIEGDIRDMSTVRRAVGGCAAVFHQAALGSVPRSIDDPVTSHEVNVNGTINVLEACRQGRIKRVIFAASSSAYGDRQESPKHEGMAPMPISPYAASKVAAEAYMRGYSAVYGLETLCLRYFNVFGPYQDPAGAYAAAIPAFVSRLLKNQQPIVYGDGEQSRDFCYIDNVCEANWLALCADASVCNGQAVNIACNRRTSINDILKLLNRLLGVNVKAIHQSPRPGDVKHSQADVRRAKELIGYAPKVFFEEGLARAIGWYKENLG
jgi:nucleoside-diphosphate-sugar epimerase